MVKKTKKICNSLNQISPFCFDKMHSFIYIIKFYKNYIKFCKSLNDYKPTQEEIIFLKKNIENIIYSFKQINELENKSEICEYFKKIIPYIEKIEEDYNIEINIIKEIMEKREKNKNISIVKIQEILNNKYNIKISRSTIHRIIRNKLKYKFRRIIVKNKDLNNFKYKLMSFIFIKIIIRAMINNYNFIFIDESHFLLNNNHYRTWIHENENLNFGSKKKDKLNIILAISINQVINYKLLKENVNNHYFEVFMKETIGMLSKEEIKNTIWIMDNLSVHHSKNIKEIMEKNKLKILYTVPYESIFNPIEIGFRYIKSFIYKKIYLNIDNLKKDVINIIKDNKIRKCLFKNFVETLKKYIIFIENNINMNLERK